MGSTSSRVSSQVGKRNVGKVNRERRKRSRPPKKISSVTRPMPGPAGQESQVERTGREAHSKWDRMSELQVGKQVKKTRSEPRGTGGRDGEGTGKGKGCTRRRRLGRRAAGSEDSAALPAELPTSRSQENLGRRREAKKLIGNEIEPTTTGTRRRRRQ